MENNEEETPELIEQLGQVTEFLQDAGADETLKVGAKGLFSWLKNKLTRKTQKEKLEAVENNPTDKNKVEALKKVVEEAIKDEEIAPEELKKQLTPLLPLVAQAKMQRSQIKNNTANADHNSKIAQDINNSTVIMGDYVGRDKIERQINLKGNYYEKKDGDENKTS